MKISKCVKSQNCLWDYNYFEIFWLCIPISQNLVFWQLVPFDMFSHIFIFCYSYSIPCTMNINMLSQNIGKFQYFHGYGSSSGIIFTTLTMLAAIKIDTCKCLFGTIKEMSLTLFFCPSKYILVQNYKHYFFSLYHINFHFLLISNALYSYMQSCIITLFVNFYQCWKDLIHFSIKQHW